jgi:hypothetical protein
MTRFAFPDLARAFRDGERFGDSISRVVEVDHLVLPTGRILACDPSYLIAGNSRGQGYTRTVSPGRYPVLLALFNSPGPEPTTGNSGTVACAMVRFRDAAVEQWEMALQPGWDPSKLKSGQACGFGVDGGTACFADEWTANLIPGEQPAFTEAILGKTSGSDVLERYRLLVPSAFGELLSSFYRAMVYGPRNPPACSGVIDAATGANIVCFPSGIGDGRYASYFGLASDGEAACLVTDFDLLVRGVTSTLELAVPARKQSWLTDPRLAEAGPERLKVEWDAATGEVAITIRGGTYIRQIHLENRPGKRARPTGCGGQGERWTYYFQLDEPLQPTARLLIEYTLRTEAL